MDHKKFLDQIEQNIVLACNLWLEDSGFTTRVAEIGMWGYAFYEDTIEIEIFEENENVENWQFFLYDHLRCQTFYHVFITPLLHELGHAQTIDFFDDVDVDFSRSAMTVFEYFESPIEIAATNWAIQFMSQEKNRVELLADLLKPFLDGLENYYF